MSDSTPLTSPTEFADLQPGNCAKSTVPTAAAPRPNGPNELLRLRIGEPSPVHFDDDASAYKLHRRFDRIGRLVGDDKMRRLLGAHVIVFGQGGVGSWAAEALARSGVGRLTLVDFDVVCVTNANRQLHAMRGTTGRAKVEVMAERLRQIHPACTVEPVQEFYNRASSAHLLATRPDLVIDAIDNVSAKAHLIATCWQQGIPLVVSGGASGRMDPTQIREQDMAQVRDDPFVSATRKVLRRRFHLPAAGKPWGIRCIHSLEAAAPPLDLHYDLGAGFRCVCPNGDNDLHSCDSRNVIYGTAGFVTGAFGLACAATAVRLLIGGAPALQPLTRLPDAQDDDDASEDGHVHVGCSLG